MLDDLQLNPDRLPLYKLIFHALQIVLSFICWVLEIAVFRSKGASVTGKAGWPFAVVRLPIYGRTAWHAALLCLTCCLAQCFLSIPAWVYLIGAPRFPRTRKFAEPHVMVAVDILYFVLWLSFFAAQAAYNTSGKCGDGCNMSKAIVALGIFNT